MAGYLKRSMLAKMKAKDFTITPRMKKKLDFPGSVYHRPCPECGAVAWKWCRTKTGQSSRARTYAQRSAMHEAHGNVRRASHRKLGF